MTTEPVKSAIASKRLWLMLPVIILDLLCFFSSSAQKMGNQSASQPDIDRQCITKLKRIDDLIKIYLHHSAGVLGFPSLERLSGLAEKPNPFICLGDKEINTSVKRGSFMTSYEIVNDPLQSKLSATPRDRIAIVTEKRPNHNGKRFVLFYDGSVRTFDETQFNELKNNSFIVRN